MVGQTPLCSGRKRDGSGDTCEQRAGYGTQHEGFGNCKFHGGNTPAGKKFAARQAGREFIRNVKFGGDRTLPDISDTTAEEALLEEVRRSVAMVRWLEMKIGEWSDDDGPEERNGLPNLVDETAKGVPATTNEQAWLLLYREERAHMAKTAKMAIDSGIAVRMVRIAESQGQMLADAVRAVLAALNLSPTQAALVPQVVPNILRSVATQQPLALEQTR